MNSIHSDIANSIPTQATYLAQHSDSAAELAATPSDSVVLGEVAQEESSPATTAKNEAGKKTTLPKKAQAVAKRVADKVQDTVDQAKYTPIKFVKKHKVSVAAALVGAAAVVGLAPKDTLMAATEVATSLAAGGTKNKIEAYSSIAELLGHAATVGVAIGAAGHVVAGVGKMIKGAVRIGKGAVAKDKIKVARGIRTSVAGARKVLTGAVIATLNAEGGAGKVATFTKKVLQPPLKKVAAVLNVGIGVGVIVDGIKHKDRSKILTGALDLSYGLAVGASILGGGPPAAAVAKVLLTAKTVLTYVRGYKKYKAKQAAQEQAAQKGTATDASTDKGKTGEAKAETATQSVAKAEKTKASKVVAPTDSLSQATTATDSLSQAATVADGLTSAPHDRA